MPPTKTRHPPPQPPLDLLAESERLFLLDLLDAPNGVAALVSAPTPFDKKPFADGGKWRGDIPKALVRRGIIVAVTTRDRAVAAPAERPSRNNTVVRLWKLIDRPAAERRLAELNARRRRPAEPTLFDDLDESLA